MVSYDGSKSAVIFRTAELYGELSNMHRHFPLRWKGRNINSSEALYQALKFPLDLIIDHRGKKVSPAIAVLTQPTPKLAKQAAHLFHQHVHPDWVDGFRRVHVMEYVIRLKYHQYKGVLDIVLDQTGVSPIVEKSYKDSFWGAIPSVDGRLSGNNVLGQLWEIVRRDRLSEIPTLPVI